jgi:hypothetical protein
VDVGTLRAFGGVFEGAPRRVVGDPQRHVALAVRRWKHVADLEFLAR